MTHLCRQENTEEEPTEFIYNHQPQLRPQQLRPQEQRHVERVPLAHKQVAVPLLKGEECQADRVMQELLPKTTNQQPHKSTYNLPHKRPVANPHTTPNDLMPQVMYERPHRRLADNLRTIKLPCNSVFILVKMAPMAMPLPMPMPVRIVAMRMRIMWQRIMERFLLYHLMLLYLIDGLGVVEMQYQL